LRGSLGLLVLDLLGVKLTASGEFESIPPAADVDLGLAERRLLKRLLALLDWICWAQSQLAMRWMI
jgi:hypothetical protein